jgi:serine/threonine protein kinase
MIQTRRLRRWIGKSSQKVIRCMNGDSMNQRIEKGGQEQTVVHGQGDSETSMTGQFERPKAAGTPVPEQFGRYRIKTVLGQGAMGAVYLAHDTQLDRQVALKIPKFTDDPNGDLLERFYREARAAATLRSPNICPVFDVGEINGQHYITMAFIEGRPLKDFTQSKKVHPEKQIAVTIRKLALALQEAHEIGVIHRDLKPANIMMDKKGEPVVMDFGLARRSRSDDVHVTQSGAILGTPAYMSPEQIAGNQQLIGPQTDIYSLGVIMYELLTGEMPFKGNLMSILQQIALNTPRPPSELRSDLNPQLEQICRKMMAGDLAERFKSMKEVAQSLQDFLKSPPLSPKTKENITPKKPASTSPVFEGSNPALFSFTEQAPILSKARQKRGRATPGVLNTGKNAATQGGAPLRRTWFIGGGIGGLLLLGIALIVGSSIGRQTAPPGNGEQPPGIASLQAGAPASSAATTPAVAPPAGATPVAIWKTAPFQDWIKSVSALPAKQQIQAVSQKLVEMNPGFDGELLGWGWRGPLNIENGRVKLCGMYADKVVDLSPLRAFPELEVIGLTCKVPGQSSQLSDLSPLQGMRLKKIYCQHTKVSDLSPLFDCRNLEVLNLLGTKIAAAEMSAFKRALPNCKVEGDGMPRAPAKSAATGTSNTP